MKDNECADIMALNPSSFKLAQKRRGWALYFIGCIVYGIMRLFGRKPEDFYGLCPYFVIGKGRYGASFGWFFICGKGADNTVKCHEIGHGVQNAGTGGLKMLALWVASIFRFFYREIFGASTPYDSWWFEERATYLGMKYASTHITYTKL